MSLFMQKQYQDLQSLFLFPQSIIVGCHQQTYISYIHSLILFILRETCNNSWSLDWLGYKYQSEIAERKVHNEVKAVFDLTDSDSAGKICQQSQ